MSKKCAKCDKTVYPAEELKCLDKVWHKVCFKCWECGMALTMKNYKGYNKLPYCSAHYPQTKATVVADTPEQRRLAQTSLMQSQAAYHADFEKNIKGTMTSVADDPEIRRVKDISNVVSQASYGRQPANNDSDLPRDDNGFVQESREPRTGYIPPQNPHMPSSRMLPIHGLVPSSLQNPVRSDQQQTYQQMRQPPPTQQSQVPMYVAMYDYEAQDTDEVSFLENDRVIQCELIDEGWMVGTIQRTGMRGMVPANYVQRI